jgi:hypothetical protein
MPTTTRAVFVRRDEQTMFDGMASATRTPAEPARRRGAAARTRPDEVFIVVMASSINFNTVWTSIFEPLPTFGFLDRLAKESYWGQRHALDYHVVGSDAAGVIVRAGSAVRNWKVGDEVTVHCNYVDDQDPSRHDDSMLVEQPADLGLRDQLRGTGRHRGGEGQPADAQADAPDVGGGGRQRAVQLDGLPDAGVAQRRPGDPGRPGARLGRVGRTRILRGAARAQLRRHADRRRLERGQGRDPARAGL